MVFVTVCDNDALELFVIAPDICEIRDDAIDARHVFFREAHAAVNDNYVVVVFKGGHVLADLADSTQRNYLNGIRVLVLGVFVAVSFRITAHNCSFYKNANTFRVSDEKYLE